LRDPGAEQRRAAADKVPPTPAKPIPLISEPPQIDRPPAPGVFAELGLDHTVALDTVLQIGISTLRGGIACQTVHRRSDHSMARPSQPASDNATHALWPAGALPKKRKISDPGECPGAPT
jgi:hypothetical protein